MTRLFRPLHALIVMILLPVVAGLLPAVVPDDVSRAIIIGSGVVIVIYVAMCVFWLIQRERLIRWKGVLRVASDRQRPHEFSQPWKRARTHLIAWGIGMTNLSQETVLMEATIKRGVKVVLEMIDPAWVRASPVLCQILDDTYNRTNFIDAIEANLARLSEFADRMNRLYGEGSIQLWVCESIQGQSGTVADPLTKYARGFIENHTPGFPHGQMRVELKQYVTKRPLDPPLLEHLVLSRQAIPRRKVPGRGMRESA